MTATTETEAGAIEAALAAGISDEANNLQTVLGVLSGDLEGQRSRWEEAATGLLEAVEQYFGYVGEPGTASDRVVPAALLTAMRWKDSAELIEAIGTRSQYLGGRVLDVTHGRGVFWKNWKPSELVACDIDPAKSPVGYSVDFTKLPTEWHGAFDAIVCDPPYKLNGRPDETVDARYGVHIYTRWQDRYDLIERGIRECAAATKRYLLLKCMDQVVSGAKRWQTIDFTNAARESGMELVDRYDMLVDPRPQPPGRRQEHALTNYSTMLVFEKKRTSKKNWGSVDGGRRSR